MFIKHMVTNYRILVKNISPKGTLYFICLDIDCSISMKFP